MTWVCDDCGWPWPLPTEPPDSAECDNCGGLFVPSDEFLRGVIAGAFDRLGDAPVHDLPGDGGY